MAPKVARERLLRKPSAMRGLHLAHPVDQGWPSGKSRASRREIARGLHTIPDVVLLLKVSDLPFVLAASSCLFFSTLFLDL